MSHLIISYIPFFLATLFFSAVLALIYYYILGKSGELGSDKRFPRQILFTLLVFIALWMLILFLPIDETFRKEISTLLGVMFSALIALSSTALLSNLMAGIVLRITQPFSIGDFVRVDGHFGRVSERGLFDTELQTEERAFVSIPNSYLIKNPVSATHASGTVVSVSLSIGFDVYHGTVETLLLQAAEKADLEKPFVNILELGNIAVTYRISGFLEETKNYVSFKSRLFASVLDELHSQHIEIMSPNIMAQRPVDPAARMIPKTTVNKAQDNKNHAENIAFDKAEKAENIERIKKQILADIDDLKEQREGRESEDKKVLDEKIATKEKRLKAIKELSLKE